MTPEADPSLMGVDVEYGRRTATLATYSLRNRSRQAWDTLASAATGGGHDAAGLIHLVKTLYAHPEPAAGKKFFADLHPARFLDFCRTFASQARTPQERFDASVLLEAYLIWRGPDAMRPLERLMLPELLASHGRTEDLERWMTVLGVRRIDRVQPHLLRANAANPFRAGHDDAEGTAAWLAHVNAALETDSLETIQIAPGPGAAFDRIICAPSGLVLGGPRVSIVMPTFEPGPRIDTALESLLAQSYQNLEILVMDDASSAETAGRLDAWAVRDPRIRVVHLRENLGSYRARNVAASEYATGEYLTVHDDDDWSHPRKIELQVAHLEANPGVPANTSLLSRATDQLVFTRINDNPVFAQRNYSSLMIRRSVLDTVGYWDLVNRGADAEMIDRIQLWSGQRVPSVGSAPLSFLRERVESLTSGEIDRGYLDPRRRWYADAYRRWHASCAEQGIVPYIGTDNRQTRSFPAPVNMIGSRSAQRPAAADIVYATDFRFPGGNSTLTCNEVEILLAKGYTVALLQLESPILGPTNLLHPRVLELANQPGVTVVSLLDQVRARLTIVRHPTIMQFIEPVRSGVETESAVAIVNHAPFEPDRTGPTYDVTQVLGRVESIFGVPARIAPESGVIRTLLTGLVAPVCLAPFDWNGVMRFQEGQVRAGDPARRPVIGRHSRDHAHKWPDRDSFELVYPIDGSYDVRILGGAAWAEKRLGKTLEDAWTVYAYGAKRVPEFLDEIDIWVYFHGEELYESFGMAALEAMAAGLVVILPHYMRSTFGDGALYADPPDARALYERIWSDPEAYAEQSRRALETARRRFGEEALAARISWFMTQEEE